MRRRSDRGAGLANTGARWLGLIGGLGLILGVQSVAFAGGPDPSTIAIDQPTPLKMGDNPSGTIVAHLAQVGGQPVSAARLELFIDGTSASSNLTNGDGAAQLNFHRDLLPGDHEIEVRFNGSRVAAASNAFSQLTVLPVDDSRLTIEPLPRLQLGQDPTVNLVAHLVSNTGNPVSGARLDLLVDGVVTGGGLTDPSGTAQITFRRVLTVGDHRVDLKFAGSRIAAPTSTSATLSVLPVDGSRLTIGPLPTLQVGQDPTVNLVARLVSAGGEPIGGARLDALVDGAPAGSGVTDVQGTAQVTFRRELAAGQHQVDLKFDGSRVAAPASTSAKLSVLPIAVHGLTVEPLPGLQVGRDPTVAVTAHLASDTGAPVPGARLAVLVDGAPATTGVTDADGTAVMTFRRELAEGEHEVEVRFAGSRAAAPASTSTPLSVAPIAVHGLRIEPLPSLQVGQDRGGTAVAHLAADSGDPVPGARLTLLIDGTAAGSGVTDASGKAELTFRRDLVAGDHPVEVRFAGSRAAAPASASGTLSVAPIAVHGLVLDPLPTLQVGLDPAATVVAHLYTDAGEPVPGVRLDLLIDGVPAGAGLTDATGSVPLRFRRDLLPGEHQVEVRFAGSRAAAPTSTSGTLSVLPALNSTLSIDPLPVVRVGVDAVVTVVAHLTQDSGEPVAGARLALLVDGTQQRLGTTDATGAAKLQFHPDLLPGDHRVDVQFGGTRGLSPASLTQTLTVLPHQLAVQVMPPVAGARIAVNGQVFTSDDQGLAHLQMDKPGAYHLEVLPFDNLEPGKKLEFSRWGDEVFTAGRDVVVPQITRLEVGFNTSYLVSLTYLDPEERPVDVKRITSATLTSSVGASQTFRPGERQWVQATRAVRRPGGLGETQLEYSVDDVQLEGANVVNAKEQRFYPLANLEFPVHLLLYDMRITARAAFAGAPIGSGVWLTHPDGHTAWLPFAQEAALELLLLPRGQYVAQVVAPGVTFAQPVALSRDQEVELKVVTYDELKTTGAALAALALGLLVVGRRSLVRWPRRTRGGLLAARPGGHVRADHLPRLEETQ